MDDINPRSITRRSATGELAIAMPLPEPSETALQPPSWFGNCWRMLHDHVHVGILLGVYASLIGLLQLKYQSSKKESAFETHTFFMFMSVAAIITFVLTYWILYHMETENSNKNDDQLSFPSVLQMILVSVAVFSIVLALLSLVFVLLLPPNLMWIGHSATWLLVLFMIAYTSIDKVTSLGKYMLIMPISKLVNYIIRDKF